MSSDVMTRDEGSTNDSYRGVLGNRPVAGLLFGDLLASVGTGMILVAMPVLTLQIHGNVPRALAIGMVEAAPFVLAVITALIVGIGRVRVSSRTLLLADCTMRVVLFSGLGVLAVTDLLSLPILIGGLLVGGTFRIAGASSRRVLATELSGPTGRFAVNGLLGINSNFALLILGPVLGGLIVATTSVGAALFFDAVGAAVLLACVLKSVPAKKPAGESARGRASRASGLRILRRRPVAARLLVVEFFFNYLYMPIEVALPLYVGERLDAGASGLGLMWGAIGVGAVVGGTLVNQLRNLPQRHVLIAIIGLWAMCPIGLAMVDDLPAAMIVFGLGGLVWAPFTPVTYSFLQASVAPEEQQQVVTLWTTGSRLAAPLGLITGGSLVELAGVQIGLVVSGVLTMLLVPIAAAAVLGHRAITVR